MRRYKYIGVFRNFNGNEYSNTVSCNGNIEAFILLTADAIRSGKHYQLKTITDEKGNVVNVDYISKITTLFK